MSQTQPPDAEGQSAEELFLLRLRYKEGRLVAAGGNNPILLDDPGTAWVVYSGAVDVFAVRTEDGQPAGPRSHICRVASGAALFGVDLDRPGVRIGLLAVPIVDTRLVKLRVPRLVELAQDPTVTEQVAGLLDGWIASLSAAMGRELPPRECKLLEPGEELDVEDGGAARPPRNVLWVSHRTGSSRLFGHADLPAISADLFPVSSHTWLQAVGKTQLFGVPTKEVIGAESPWAGLNTFHRAVLSCLAGFADQADREQGEQLQRKVESDRWAAQNASYRLASILQPEASRRAAADGAGDPLFAACALVGQALGVVMRHPAETPEDKGEHRETWEKLDAISRASRVRIRRVTLTRSWWRQDGGPLLGFKARTGGPVAPADPSVAGDVEDGPESAVALLPRSWGGYDLVAPGTATPERVTPKVAASLSPFAFSFYRPFPERALTARDLLRFGLRGHWPELAVILLVGIAVGVLGMLLPIVTALILDAVIPGAQSDQLLQLTLGLAVAAVASALFLITRSFAILRLRTKMDVWIQAAVWDRVLALPVPFFRHYAAGDLALRAMGMSTIRQMLTEATVSSVLGSLFSVFSFALLFYYAADLALVATVMTAAIIGITFLVSSRQLGLQRELAGRQGQISGIVLQLLSGISKLRVAGAEIRAFAIWAGQFSAQKQIAFRARGVANTLAVFNAASPILASMVIFALVSQMETMSTGRFLAFNAAFGQFLFSMLAMTSALTTLLQAIPVLERARPILETLPEVDGNKRHPGRLSGAIEISHLSFRYNPDGPLILNDISMRVEPGQFVAFVGPSGAGKSSVFRLLLGFETPETGTISYDGQELALLDVSAVRQQMGIVFQNSQLMPGSIFANIVGSSLFTLEDAWEAARLAGVDEDIRQMPMGMHTTIGEGAATISGGQRQRLMIARAIVSRPRILLFDEATSALDNRTQAIVARSLENLQATRVVIAHRLSTIVHADQIFVLQAGRIVQSGTYDVLVSQPGPFQELAKRQLA